jgi:predicted O-methyltransferase YrrM
MVTGASHIMFIDSDMMFPKTALKQLLTRDKDIIGANYIQRVRQDQWSAQIRGESVISTEQNGVQEVDSIGMGVCLIKTEVFKTIPQPWFNTPFENNQYMGEDNFFCRLAQEHGYKIYVDHDLSQQVRHIGEIKLGVDNFQIEEYQIPDIEGWMLPIEMQFLYSTAKNMGSVIELGSWKGRSTHAIASGCSGPVYAIDHWKGSIRDATEELAKHEDVFAVFKENMKQFKNIIIVNKNIDDAVNDAPDADMVFIDAEHNYEAIRRDIINWLPKAKKMICGHDYSTTFPGVVKAVSEIIGEPDGVQGTIWFKVIR